MNLFIIKSFIASPAGRDGDATYCLIKTKFIHASFCIKTSWIPSKWCRFLRRLIPLKIVVGAINFPFALAVSTHVKWDFVHVEDIFFSYSTNLPKLLHHHLFRNSLMIVGSWLSWVLLLLACLTEKSYRLMEFRIQQFEKTGTDSGKMLGFLAI